MWEQNHHHHQQQQQQQQQQKQQLQSNYNPITIQLQRQSGNSINSNGA